MQRTIQINALDVCEVSVKILQNWRHHKRIEWQKGALFEGINGKHLVKLGYNNMQTYESKYTKF